MDDFDELRKLRNCIQHFAVTIKKPQASSLVAKGFNFLVNLCDHELPEVIEGFDEVMRQIKLRLHEVDDYVAVRLEAVASQLDDAEFLFT